MKNYACMLIVLSAISVFSFTQAFETATRAVGGDDPPCNGSDINSALDCEQLPGGQSCESEYEKVVDVQDYKDVHYHTKTECAASGCRNVLDNHSPRATPCVKHVENNGAIDPP